MKYLCFIIIILFMANTNSAQSIIFRDSDLLHLFEINGEQYYTYTLKLKSGNTGGNTTNKLYINATGPRLYFNGVHLQSPSQDDGWVYNPPTSVITPYPNDLVGIDTSNPESKLSINGKGLTDAMVYSKNTQNSGYSAMFESSMAKAKALYGKATGSGTTYGGKIISLTVNGIGIFGKGGKYGGQFLSTQENGKGIYGLTASPVNAAVIGENSNSQDLNSLGGYFVTSSGEDRTLDGGKGMVGEAINNSNTRNYGGSFIANGIGGIGIEAVGEKYGGYFTTSSNSGTGLNNGIVAAVYAEGNDEIAGYFRSSGINGVGIYAESPIIGIYGKNSGWTYDDKYHYGGYFEVHSNQSVGVYGVGDDFGGKFENTIAGYFGQIGLNASAKITGGLNPSAIGIKAVTHSDNSIGADGHGWHGIEADADNYGYEGDPDQCIAVYGSSTGNYSIGVKGNGRAYNFFASGDGRHYGQESSKRWKKNIKEIQKPLDMIKKMRGVYFDWDKEHGGKHDVGMIAEEVGKVIPEIVVYEENKIDAIGMDYSKLTSLLVSVINAQQEILKDQREKLKTLSKLF